MPPTLKSWVAGWFMAQAVLMPGDVWAKRDWMDYKPEAARRVRWCRTVLAALEGTDENFAEARKLASAGIARFSPVEAWRGWVTLTVNAAPFAEVKSFKAGDAWIVKDSRRTADAPSGEVQYTPLKLDDLDIADYTVVFIHPQLGERSLNIRAADLRHGGKFVFSGSLNKPESFALREDR
jgi:hypothetical protein